MTTKLASFFAAAALALVGCGSDNKQTPADAPKPIDAPPMHDAPTTDGPLVDAGVDANLLDASCFTSPDPNSHYQIINACTTAQKVYTTHPTPPLQYVDGGLPPLPP
jgi:hypothetical protein